MSHHPLPTFTRESALAMTSRPVASRAVTLAIVLFALGTLIFLVGVFMAPDRAWRAFHANWLFFTVLSSAGVAFVAVQRITTARWSREIIRFLEGYVAFLPVALLFLSVWYVYTSLRLDVGMNPQWTGAGWAEGLRARMRRAFRDERREIHSTHSLQGKLAVYLLLAFGFGWSVLAWDLSMGLSLHFQSALYGWWFFMGGWLNALALFTVLTIWWRRHLGAYELIKEVHYHDLGKLVFAFTAFWGYLTFGQYLVIWYGNLPEETHFMRLRLITPWKAITVASVVLVFAFPFFGLLSRSAKVFLPTLAFFALASLAGMWLMRYIEVYPSTYGEVASAPFGIWEIGTLLLYVGAWGWAYANFMNAFPRVRVTLLTSPYRDEVQVPVDPETMEPLPAHE
jgi:uncharacterized membrane protein YiaA